MDHLKKFVEANRDAFPEKEPLPGHWLRFKMKAYLPAWGGRKITFAQWASSSAAAVLLFAAMLPVLWPGKDSTHDMEVNQTITPNGTWFAGSQIELLDVREGRDEDSERDTLNHEI